MHAKSIDPATDQTVPAREWVGLVILHVSIPLTLFVCGGTVRWWPAWAFAVLFVSAGVGGRIWAERRHPGLLAERERTRSLKTSNVRAWDKVLAPLMALSLSFPIVIVAGLDHRLGWSPVFPAWLNVTGLAVIALGYAFAAWAIAENRFFSSMVRI